MIAHMRKSDYEIQTVQKHLESVTFIAGYYGGKLGFRSLTSLAAFLHDMGKNTTAFSTYIEHAVKETGVPLEKIDHSSAGAKYLYETFYIGKPASIKDVVSNYTIEIACMVIMSHHSGLQNFMQIDGTQSDFFRRVLREDLPYYDEVCERFLKVEHNKERVEALYEEAQLEVSTFFEALNKLKEEHQIKDKNFSFIHSGLLLKYIFSCLIDADRTDARRFEEDDTSELFPDYTDFFEKSYDHLLAHLKVLGRSEKAGMPINVLRNEMSEQCDRLADTPSSIYQLSIPTGGGKTLASLRYALKHAIRFGKERIIYVAPFTTILEQNADEVRKVIRNSDAVLEHHAHVIDESAGEDALDYYGRSASKKIQLARDNWDHPIIFTTLVQFLDTFYAKGTRKSRRLHNLTNAVIIFDEVQSVPVKHIPLFNSAVNFLHHFGRSSIVLCTATQPSLAETKYPLLMPENSEMIRNLSHVVKAFKRVDIENRATTEGWTAEQISEFAVEELDRSRSILIILNTKKAVLNVFQQLKDSKNISVYHLSTSMCPQHRKHILDKVREILVDPSKRVICVSTQLIEAGVDISFGCVIRSMAGLDAVAQAAGRCNRHGEREKGKVFIIRARDETLSKLPEMTLGQKVLQEDVLRHSHLANDLLSPVAIETYFKFFLGKAQSEIKMNDRKLNAELIEMLGRGDVYFDAIPQERPKTFMRTMYKTLESHFQVIEAQTIGILVPYGERGQYIITALHEDVHDYKLLNQLLREAQMYSINVYRHTLQALIEEDLIFPLRTEGMYALQHRGYHKDYGLSLEGKGESYLPTF